MPAKAPQQEQRLPEQAAPATETEPPARSLSDSSTKRDSASPTMTNYSFEPNDEQNVQAFNGGGGVRELNQGTPADPSSQRPTKKSSKSELKKNTSTMSKSHGYYAEAFALRETGPVVPKAAPVWVELKTNVILENEFEFTKSLSQVIAKRYSRPESTVAISVDHSACLIMGGTFEGCYLLTINSLSSISTTCNKRNTALISEWINANLGVPSSRGYIRFVDPEAANYAVGGLTVLDMMEKEKAVSRGGSTLSTSNNSEPRAKKGMMGSIGSRHHKSTLERIVDRQPSNKNPQATTVSTSNEHHDAVPDLAQVSMKLSQAQQEQSSQSMKPIKRGRSMFNLFGRSQKA